MDESRGRLEALWDELIRPRGLAPGSPARPGVPVIGPGVTTFLQALVFAFALGLAQSIAFSPLVNGYLDPLEMMMQIPVLMLAFPAVGALYTLGDIALALVMRRRTRIAQRIVRDVAVWGAATACFGVLYLSALQPAVGLLALIPLVYVAAMFADAGPGLIVTVVAALASYTGLEMTGNLTTIAAPIVTNWEWPVYLGWVAGVLILVPCVLLFAYLRRRSATMRRDLVGMAAVLALVAVVLGLGNWVVYMETVQGVRANTSSLLAIQRQQALVPLAQELASNLSFDDVRSQPAKLAGQMLRIGHLTGDNVYLFEIPEADRTRLATTEPEGLYLDFGRLRFVVAARQMNGFEIPGTPGGDPAVWLNRVSYVTTDTTRIDPAEMRTIRAGLSDAPPTAGSIGMDSSVAWEPVSFSAEGTLGVDARPSAAVLAAARAPFEKNFGWPIAATWWRFGDAGTPTPGWAHSYLLVSTPHNEGWWLPSDGTDVRTTMAGVAPVLFGSVLSLLVLGLFVVARRDLLRTALVKAEERERIARDAHDRVYNRLGALSKQVSLVAEGLPAAAAERLDDLSDDIRVTAHDLQEILGDAGGRAIDPGEGAGLAGQLEAICRAQGARLGLAVEFRHAAFAEPPAEVSYALQCIVEEALTNASRHGHAATAVVEIAQTPDGRIGVTVSDDGSGIPEGMDIDALPAECTGLRGIRQRATTSGGTLRVERLDPGTRVVVEVRA